jgi:hypothetical protein
MDYVEFDNGFLLLRCKKREEQIYHELTALQEREREIVYEWGGPLTALQTQLDHSLAAEEKLPLMGQEKAEPQQEFEETSSLQEQVGPLSQPVRTYHIYLNTRRL